MTHAAPTNEVVGRGPAISAVRSWYDARRPVMLVIDGPAGLGKTTVWRVAVAELERAGARVLASEPTEAESRLSFLGLADLLAPDYDAIAALLPPPQAVALALALRLEEGRGRILDETAVARGALAATRLLARQHGSLVLAIDDLRWLDPPTLAVITYIARHVETDDGIRILGTHRIDEPDPPGLDRIAAVDRLALEPISVGGIHRIVRLHTGIVLPRPRLLEVHEMASGNPLHAIELVRSTEPGQPMRGRSLARLFAARVGALPAESARAMLMMAASADRSLDRLDRAWRASRPDGSDSLGAAIGLAIEAGLVVMEGGRLRPVHPLVAHVTYEEAEPQLRRATHRALAATSADAEERALHLGRSVDEPNAAIADQMEAAAEERGHGLRAARAAMFEHAARITPPGNREVAGRRWLASAAAWLEAGDTRRVRSLLEPMIAAWPPGPQRAEARWRLGTALDETGLWPEATALWRAALDDTTDPALRSPIMCSMAITALYTASGTEALDLTEVAVEEAERSADPGAIARALAVRAFILVMAGRDDGAPLMNRALSLEAALDRDLGDWSPTALSAECARHAGDVATALSRYAVVLQRATARGDANLEQWAAYGLASAAIVSGYLERATEMADLVLDIADQTDVMRIPARVLRAHVGAYRGELERARDMLVEATAMARAGDEVTHLHSALVVKGALETCSGDDRAAAAAYREASVLADRMGLAHAARLRALLLEVEAAAGAHELRQAGDALDTFDRLVGPEPPGWSVPLRRRAVAARLAASDNLEAARIELEAAAADEAALAPDVARALLALAGVLRRQRRYRDSRAAAERARLLFDELGMMPFVEAAQREAARTPGRRAGGEGELSPAESRVAELVAAGLTNRDVAEELVLSVKTVEVTLTRVYGKLGLRSRAELAARFRDREIETIV
ncbi:MAG: AAA family ATPase [Chloroflexi bacterium]|nr:AAA family ATPase [Chloroflexota bacterium]